MTYIVSNGETLASIAAAQNLQLQDLAAANRLDPTAELEAGQALAIPADAEPAGPQQSPSERTDAALANYQQALATSAGLPGPLATTPSARSALEAAVTAELAPIVNGVDPRVPNAPTSQQTIASLRETLLARHAGDPAAQQALSQAIDTFATEHRADVLAQADVSGSSVTPGDRLGVLGRSLANEPPAVVAELLQQPSVQARIDAAADWVGEPYAGVDASQASTDHLIAEEAAQRLSDLTDTLPPEMATALVERSLPTIERIAGVEGVHARSGAYTDLSRAVGAMAGAPGASAVADQVADAFLPQVGKWGGFYLDPGTGIVRNAVGNGGSPELSIALAGRLEAAGRPDEAGAVLRAAAQGTRELQANLDSTVETYAEHTEELLTVLDDTGSNLSPEQRQRAIDAYVAGKGTQWQTRLEELQAQITRDAGALLDGMASLHDLPPDLAGAGQGVDDILGAIAGDATTQDGLSFALSLDPNLLAGREGASLATFLADEGQKGSDFLKNLANAYVHSQLMPAIGAMNPNDPASVSRARAAISELEHNGARLFGIPQSEIDAGVSRLRALSDTLADPGARLAPGQAFDTVQGFQDTRTQLTALRDTQFSSGPAAMAFRTLALGMSGAAFLTTAQTTIDDPSAQNAIGLLAYSVGLAQDATAFASTVGAIDTQGRAAQWGTGASWAGRFTAKFVGVLNTAYYAAGAIDQWNNGSVPGVLFNAAGAGGAFLTLLAANGTIGAWGGPVGVGIMMVATGGVALVQYRQDIDTRTGLAEDFYRAAGIDGATADVLADEASETTNILRAGLELSPAQIQSLAKDFPEVFWSPPEAEGTVAILRANGIGADDAHAFLTAARQDNPQFAEQFATFFTDRASGDGGTFDANARQMVQERLPGALAIAQDKSPELFDTGSADRDQAVRDYEDTPTSDPGMLGNLLKDTSDAYRAEVIRQMRDDGTLDVFVHEMSSNYHYNGWPEAARDGIEAAREAGVLSDDQAESYLSQLGV